MYVCLLALAVGRATRLAQSLSYSCHLLVMRQSVPQTYQKLKCVLALAICLLQHFLMRQALCR